MGCQKNIAKEIIEADADYVLALKANHEIAQLQSYSEEETDHGRKTTWHNTNAII